MTGTLTVGVDESEGAGDALRWAVDESSIRHASVVAILAWGWIDQHTDPVAEFNPDYSATDADTALEHVIARSVPRGVSPTIERRVVCDLPARALLDAAADSDMLVVGARGLGGFRGLLVGSVSQHCVHHATVPTVVVRNPRAEPGAAGVVVGIDGSTGAQRALSWAAEAARLRSTRLIVVHGYDLPLIGAYPRFTPTYDEGLLSRSASQLLDNAIDSIDTNGLDIAPVVSSDGAARSILRCAADADLVVVGSRGLGAAQRWLLGSVATQVLHHAPGPIAVIPAATENP
jgi:nucleotide-binding universal stress UspA family protein